MKKHYFIALLITITASTVYSQLLEKSIYSNNLFYKKHYSHNIEGGTVDGLPREFIVGNQTDYLVENRWVSGQSIAGNIIYPGKYVTVLPEATARIQLTDFTVFPTAENQYAAGTGIYYPETSSGYGFPFLGIYDRRTMDLLYLYTYDLLYPEGDKPKNTAGLRIKFSPLANAFYISGVISENIFTQMNLNDIVGRSQGFILKIDFSNPTAGNAIIFNPDMIPTYPDSPLLCAVTDMEIDPREEQIIFTGINTKSSATGYYCPFAGKIDMNLNMQWARAYQFGDDRYSGVDVEYGRDKNFYVLMNSYDTKMAVMELSNTGSVIQEPVAYEFSFQNMIGPARGHVLHYNLSDLKITGNYFHAERDQHLFSYDILDATNLNTGSARFKSYMDYPIPVGKQEEVTNYWAPENSLLSDGNLSIVGIYNNIDTQNNEFGYCLVHTLGYDTIECLQRGDVEIVNYTSHPYECSSDFTSCRSTDRDYEIDPQIPDTYVQICPSHDKSTLIVDPVSYQFSWKIKNINTDGITAEFNSEETTPLNVIIYDLTGRIVYSENLSIKGQKVISFNFETESQMYLINVNNGTTSETKKVVFIK